MRGLLYLLPLLFIVACTPGDVSYCENQGFRPQTPEWAKCFSRYHRNKEIFEADRIPCAREAERLYPNFLYDRERLVRRPVFDNRGVYRGTHVDNEPGNWWQNARLDELRGGVIAECMAKKGWNDADDWQAGGRKVK